MKESIVDLLLQLCKASSIQFHIVLIFSWDDTSDSLNLTEPCIQYLLFFGLKGIENNLGVNMGKT